MYCVKCGSELPDDALFCPVCGRKVWTDADFEVSEEGVEQPPSPKKTGKAGIIVGAVVAVIVVAVAASIGLWWKSDQDAKAAAQAEWDRTHAPQAVVVQIEAPGFDEQATAIPVQVTGTDLDGTHVEEVRFLHPQETDLQVVQGSYDLTFPGGYFAGDGTVVKAPGTTQHIEVWIDNASTSSSQVSTNASEVSASSGNISSSSSSAASPSSAEPIVLDTIVYTPVPNLEVTDDLINVIKNWASKDEKAPTKADDLSKKVIESRDKAVAEEAQRVAEAEAARKQAAEDFCVYYIGNQTVIDAGAGKTEPIVNGQALALQFVEPGSALAAQIQSAMTDANGNLMVSAAVAIHDSTAVSVDGDTVVVSVTYSASQGNRGNWLQDADEIMVYCTFASDGLIIEAEKDGNIHLTGSVG